MTTTDLGALLARIEADNVVTAEEVLQMRRCVWDDNQMSVIEADALFRINDNCRTKPVEWADFFVSGMTDFLVRQTMPTGYIDEANAAWLIQRISADGVVETQTEMALLMNVLKHAENVTERLEMFALAQVKESVLNGKGILARGAALKAGCIGETEVKILRAILYSAGGEGGNWISRAEAELLFDLNDATADAENHASWEDLFRAGIANHLMMLSTPAKTGYSEALRRDEWMTDRSKVVTFQSLTSGLVDSYKAWLSKEPKYSILNEAERAISERITGDEAKWLIDRLNRDGKLTPNETALLRFLREDCPDIHESLKPLLNAA